MVPLVLRTKYAFHSLLWLLDPDLILDVGSMDGSDSKKFKQLVPSAEVVASEGNSDNYRVMCANINLQKSGVRVINRLVSDQEGRRHSVIRKSIQAQIGLNKGTSSAMRGNGIQRDLILIKETRHNANRRKISALLHVSKWWFAPIFSRIIRTRRPA